MKNNIMFGLMFALLLTLGASHVSAAQLCGDPSQSGGGTTYVVCGNGNPSNVQSPWGRNSDVPNINPGTKIMFSNGVTTFDLGCPAYFTQQCVDITGSQYWKTNWGAGLTRVQ